MYSCADAYMYVHVTCGRVWEGREGEESVVENASDHDFPYATPAIAGEVTLFSPFLWKTLYYSLPSLQYFRVEEYSVFSLGAENLRLRCSDMVRVANWRRWQP